MTRAGEPTIGVVIPTRNAARWLERTLAVLREEPEPAEVLVVDSGSSDGTPEIAARQGARVVSIDPREFGHGRTRNLAMELTDADLVCFLTQDAVPLPGWLASWRPAFARHPRVGAAFGPQLPWPDTPVPVARELDEFFPRFAHPTAPDEPAVLGSLDDPFLSNVNACYRRDCWRELRFPDVPYGEDRAFALAMREAGWSLAYVPRARVRHAHAYPPLEFARRYFDEFRALALVFGYRERWLDPVALLRRVLGETLRDVHWARRRRGVGAVRTLARSPRWALHHAIRATFAPLGSRGLALPAPLQRALSLEGRAIRRGELAVGARGADERGVGDAALAVRRVEPWDAADPYLCGRLEREGPAPTRPRLVHASNGDRPLHVAFVVPPWERGSGGHMTILRFVRYLEQRGHTVTLWLHDPRAERRWAWNGVLRHSIVSDFMRVRAPVFNGFDQWHGADVAVATGWETVYRVLLLPDVGDRVYLVQDHEPDFFPASAERVLAERTYTFPELRIVTAGRWLSELLRERYDVESDFFSLGVDHDVYKPDPRVERIPMSIAMYGRFVTGRRGVPLARDAIALLWERGIRPRVFVFGTEDPPGLPFPYEFVGVVPPSRLARLYNEVTVGIALSLTNYSLVPLEMLACGLPCVDVAGGSLERELGRDAGVVYAEAQPAAIADALFSVLCSSAERRRQLAQAATAATASLEWADASARLDRLLRMLAHSETPVL
ncbi:glycosyltransferase [Thermoleophilum album]|uniref:4,4'-diaponeurosporenoate glycosyltransferase n=1 Tax=Thermoleophilum album TaxID=29539 RepID=A0A1H6FN00_THEAL|nr:glycosyltransferase [Thermoleophilum album]SEH11722.1 Glycosyltransferase, GT2 family [Thermoleophilum album]